MKILVLGAGVIGVTSAWYLACEGHEVTVIDRQPEPGMETSRANGGQVSAGDAEPWACPAMVPKLWAWIGREDAPLLFRPRASWAQWEWGLRFLAECIPGRFEKNSQQLTALARFSRDSLEALRSETGIEYDRQRGILRICNDRREFELLAAHAAQARAEGIGVEVVDAAEALRIEPALGGSTLPIAGGLFVPEDESGDAFRFTQGLAELAMGKGVLFLANTTATALRSSRGRIVGVQTKESGELISADAYVVALGSYSPLLLSSIGVSIPVYPLKGYSVTIALSTETARLAPTVSISDEAGKLVYSRLGERLRIAGTAELAGFDLAINKRRCRAIVERTNEVFPGVSKGAEIEYWAGLRPATPSNIPLVGATRYPNLFLNTGHGTLGWTLACGSGKALAEIVSGRTPPVDFVFCMTEGVAGR